MVLLLFTPIGLQIFSMLMLASLIWLIVPEGIKQGIEGAGRNFWIVSIDTWRAWDTQCSLWTNLPSWFDPTSR